MHYRYSQQIKQAYSESKNAFTENIDRIVVWGLMQEITTREAELLMLLNAQLNRKHCQ